MPAEAYYTQENHGPFELFDLGDFALEDGGTLTDTKLAYVTHGTLNAAKDNAILVTSWYTGTSKIMEQIYVGEGHAIDPAKHFVILVSQLGSGISSSPHNQPAPQNGPNFPKVRIGDDVNAQHRLVVGKFGLTSLAMVFGGSMGAQQAYEWAVRYPDFTKRAAALAGTAKARLNAIAIGTVIRDILTSDPAFAGGAYASSDLMDAALRRHAHFFTLIGWCPDFLDGEIWRGLGFASYDEFMTGFMEAFFAPMDPNNLLAMVWKWQNGDVSRHTGGDLAAALGSIKARTLVMPIETDLIFPPASCEEEAKQIPGSLFRVIGSKAGHLGLFAVEPDYMRQVDANLAELLAIPA